MKKGFFVLLMLSLACVVWAQAPHKYGIKCGIVKTVTDNGGRKSYNTLWFDNYGAREKSVTTMDMGGGMGEAEWITISLEDGNSYMIDNTRQAVTVMKRQDVNYLDMPEQQAKARKAKVLGEETIGGRKCVKWEEHVKQVLHTATVVSWVWKGIPVQYNIDNPKSQTTLVELKQPKSIDPKTFAIPKDYKQKNL